MVSVRTPTVRQMQVNQTRPDQSRLAELSQLGTFFGVFALIFAVKSLVFLVSP